jgi:hypothetical protein
LLILHVAPCVPNPLCVEYALLPGFHISENIKVSIGVFEEGVSLDVDELFEEIAARMMVNWLDQVRAVFMEVLS